MTGPDTPAKLPQHSKVLWFNGICVVAVLAARAFGIPTEHVAEAYALLVPTINAILRLVTKSAIQLPNT